MSSDDDWRFDTDDVGDVDSSDEHSNRAGDRTPSGEGVLGTTDAESGDPEPQSIAAENVVFVLLGAATMVGIIALLVV